ncbi:WXG100 family type VII secretion target [Streptomyces sp. NPDC051567]|uniref:WXG100 family type VII secretion target n=1 Tax=Streptomyces sp. NPDC051567 TaxID=3365660 RepID=UPI0037A6A19E
MATNFDGFTHEQLLVMVSSLNPETVKARGVQLTQAAVVIKEIGESLKKHRVSGWEGAAADAFQDWVSRAGSATLSLSDYSALGGKWMTEAGQTMVEVKANMPAYDTGAAGNLEAALKFRRDPDAQQIYQEASSKLNGDHDRAVQQLMKLAQSYETSARVMDRAEIPMFPPPPGEFVPTGVRGSEYVARAGGDSGGGSGSGGPSYGAPAPGGGGPSNTSGWVPGHSPQPGVPLPSGPGVGAGVGPGPMPGVTVPDREVSVGLDNVGTLPEKTLPPATVAPGGLGPGSPGTGGGGVAPGGLVPPLTLPPVGGVGMPGGGVGPGGAGSGGLLPGVSGPGGAGKAGGIGGAGGLPPRDSGIVGGRPVSAGGPGAGIPRGTVIGAEGTQAGRGMGGMMGGAGMGAGPAGPVGQSGPAVGRRLATEPGGVVGGRQPGAGSRGITGGQPFAPGGVGPVGRGPGTGVVGGATGQAGAGARTPGQRREDQGGERPGYLAEDEETWKGNRRVVPPVID